MEQGYTLRLEQGSLCVYENGQPLIRDITGYIKYNGDDYNVITLPRAGAWRLLGDTAQCGNMRVQLAPCGGGFAVRAVFTNTGEGLFRPCEYTPFAGQLLKTVERGVCNRYVEVNGNRVCEMQSAIDTVRTVYNTVYESAENAAFDTPEGEAFAFGALTYEKYFSGVTFTREGFITARCNTEWHPIPAGGEVTSEWFYFARGESCVAALEGFAAAVAQRAGVKRSQRANPTGFCTWYYYGGKIRPQMLRQNMAVLESHRQQLPVQYIQLDDGWYDCWGSWNNNDTFADIRDLAREITARGFLPGIWLAPFGCSEEGSLVREHPDYFVRTKEGRLWHKLSLDYTNPEVRAYMAGVFRRITYDWGFKYIKMDIITGTLCPGVHYDPNATALENYRLGLKTFRENVPEDVFLLGCTAPLGGACGLVDGMRVSCDVFERWESLLSVFNAVLKRYYYHRSYFLIDADCLIIRKKENEDKECWRLCTRTDEEIRVYVTAMAASGGIVMLSDKLPNLSEEQLRLISRLFPANQEAARPLDMMDAFVPGVLDFGRCCGARTVALINWSDVPRTLRVENGPALVWEFWDQQFSVYPGGAFAAQLAPRSAKVFYFTDLAAVGHAPLAAVGSDASVKMQTPSRLADDGSLCVTPIKAEERVFIAARMPLCPAQQGTAAEKLTEKDGWTVYAVTAEGPFTLRPQEE